MKQSILEQLLLYRYRYLLGYSLFTIALVGLLITAGLLLGGAVTENEMSSAVKSNELTVTNIVSQPIVDLPYHVLQKVSISALGLTPLAIKLPSLIVGLASGIALLFLLRRFFTQNIAVLTSIIAVATSQFLVVSQSGAPDIMLIFWPIVLLLFAIHIVQQTKGAGIWKILFFIALALSFYTPLSLYTLAVIAIAAILHPHLRYVLRHLSKKVLAVSALLAIILLIPFFAGIIRDPTVILTLLGFPTNGLSLGAISENFMLLLNVYTGFSGPSITNGLLIPLYGFASLALVLLGIMKLVVDHHSARSYALIAWLIILGILLVVNPEYIIAAAVPTWLLLGVGIQTLLQEWYALFPFNPYARAAALVPLVILIGGIIYSGVDRYINSFQHSPQIATQFSRDLTLVRSALESESKPRTLVVAADEHAFYSILGREYPSIAVTTSIPKTTESGVIVLNESASINAKNVSALGYPSRVITNGYADNNVRLLLYR